MQADNQVTLRTRKFLTNRLLQRKQMVRLVERAWMRSLSFLSVSADLNHLPISFHPLNTRPLSCVRLFALS